MDKRGLGAGSGFALVMVAGFALAAGLFGGEPWLAAGAIALAVTGVGLFGVSVRGWVPEAGDAS